MPRSALRLMVCVTIGLLAASACQSSVSDPLTQSGPAVTDDQEPAGDAPSVPPPDAATPPVPSPKPDPQRFVPSGRVGSEAAYNALIAELEPKIPAELRSSVPWPDLRNPDPAVAQLEIFAMWIWMQEHVPDPVLIDVLAARDGPTREEIASIFGELDRLNQIEVRPEAPYRAFDQRAVTHASAGLPLWLSRDVPDDAVVIYYSDNSGPVEVRDRDTGEVIERRAGIATRTWLSIMVPTEVGWLLWRDALIDPSNPDVEVPDFAVPDPDASKPKPQV
jgi:hypothetical protein